MPGIDGKPRSWVVHNEGNETVKIAVQPRLSVNDLGLIHQLVMAGSGIGCLPSYLCAAALKARRLVRLFPEWDMPLVEMSVVFPGKRDLSPTVRAFVDRLVATAASDVLQNVAIPAA